MKNQYVLFFMIAGCMLASSVEAQKYNACETKASWSAVVDADIPNSQGQEKRYYPECEHRRPVTNGPQGCCGQQGCSAEHGCAAQQGGCGPQGCPAPHQDNQQGGCGPGGCPAPQQGNQTGGCGPGGCPAPH